MPHADDLLVGEPGHMFAHDASELAGTPLAVGSTASEMVGDSSSRNPPTWRTGMRDASQENDNEEVESMREVQRRILLMCKRSYWKQMEAGTIQRDAAKCGPSRHVAPNFRAERTSNLRLRPSHSPGVTRAAGSFET